MVAHHKTQRGIGAVAVVVAIAVIAAIGYAGWNLHRKQQATKANQAASQTAQANAAANAEDPYAGWKSQCDRILDGCFRYPADWRKSDELNDLAVKAFVQNPASSVNVEFREEAAGSATPGTYQVKHVEKSPNGDNYTIVGGYYTDDNLPGYRIVDTATADKLKLAVGASVQTSKDLDLVFASSQRIASFRAARNTTEPTMQADKADAWFGSNDGKTALKIAQSYHYKGR